MERTWWAELERGVAAGAPCGCQVACHCHGMARVVKEQRSRGVESVQGVVLERRGGAGVQRSWSDKLRGTREGRGEVSKWR